VILHIPFEDENAGGCCNRRGKKDGSGVFHGNDSLHFVCHLELNQKGNWILYILSVILNWSS
jgi:hypothetical protein